MNAKDESRQIAMYIATAIATILPLRSAIRGKSTANGALPLPENPFDNLPDTQWAQAVEIAREIQDDYLRINITGRKFLPSDQQREFEKELQRRILEKMELTIPESNRWQMRLP